MNFIHFPGCKKSINPNTIASIEWGAKNRDHKIVLNFAISEKPYKISLSKPIDKETLENYCGIRNQQVEWIKHLESEMEIKNLSGQGVVGLHDAPKDS